MKNFIQFVLSVKDSVNVSSPCEERKITVISVSFDNARATYFSKSERVQVQVLYVVSANLIGEEETRLLLQNKDILFDNIVAEHSVLSHWFN